MLMHPPLLLQEEEAVKLEVSPLLSIVIVSWNTRELLAQCLHTVADELAANFEPDTVETFVVDNVSSDGSVEHVRQHFPWVRVIENRSNAGFAAANNQAIARSRGRYVLLLNPDTRILPGALRQLIDFLEANPHAGAAGSRLLNPDGTLQTSCHPRPTLVREFWRMFHLDKILPYALYRMEQWSTQWPRDVDIVQGAALLVRRAVIEQVGALDTDYFIYTEEVDLCYRIQCAGWRIFWVPTSVVIHYGGQSTQQVAAAMFLRLYESKIIFFRKSYGRLAAQGYKGILIAASLTRLAISPLAWLVQPAQRHRHQALAGHYGRLLRALFNM